MTPVRVLLRLALAILIAFAAPWFAAPARAQQTAALTGQVRDVSGGAIPGVAVTVTGPGASGSRRTAFSDAAGEFRIPDLAAGDYELTTELAGFRPLARTVPVSSGTPLLELTLDLAGLAESVIVRGDRTSRSLMDTAASVEVFDAEMLERRPPLDGTNDLFSAIPNVTATGTSNLAPAVRGADGTGPAQGADAFFAGTRPRLNVQIDGRPASYNEVVFGNVGLWDVEQVEMFRGAQSTVQGRNAMAGTLVVKTKDPTFTPEAQVRVGAGMFDDRQVSAAVSGPLVADRVAARFSLDRTESDSFVKGYQPYAGVDAPGHFEQLMLRGKLLVQPDRAQRFSTLITVTHSDVEGPQVETVARPFDDLQSAFPAMPVFAPTTTSAIAESRWSASDHLSYEHTLAWTDLHVERRAEPGTGIGAIDGHQLMFEPRLRFASAGRRVNGFGGLYLFRSRQDESLDLFGGGLFDDRVDTVAGFGEVTVALPRRLELTLAARLEREHHRRQGATGPFAIDLDTVDNVLSPKVGLEWRPSDTLSLGTVILRGYNGGGAGFTYDFPFVSYTFEPEHVVTSESYARTDLRDGTVSLTANVFYSRYTDMQLPFDLNPDPAIWAFVVRNADAVTTYGTELGARWRPTSSWQTYLNVGLLRAAITSYPGSGVEDHRLAQSPALSVNAGVVYRQARGLDAAVDVRSSSSYFSSITNDPLGRVDPYGVVNGQAGYTIRGTRLFVYVNNLLDSTAAVLLEPGSTRADDVATLVKPRRAGIGVTWGF